MRNLLMWNVKMGNIERGIAGIERSGPIRRQ
jgi:hypothetical protein